MTAASPAAPRPGELIAGYRVERLLGHGACGAVYLTVDPATGEPVALKLLPPLAPATGVDEAAVASRLSHPAIAAVRAAGRTDAWRWIAYEAAPGVPLERYARGARLLPPPLVAQLGERIAGGLAHAHALGVVHRDIKPSNVIVDLPAGSLKITDFGVAHTDDAERTGTGVVLGSPAYLAPEQLAGAPATAAGDLYALGVTLFQLLAGRLPHEELSMGELLRQVAQGPAPDVREWQPDVPPVLAALVRRLMARWPDERPARAADVARELAACAAATPEPGGGPKSQA